MHRQTSTGLLRALVTGLLMAALGACSPSEDVAPAPVDTGGAVMDAEAEGLPELPTHWTTDEPIGNGAGPVTQEHLLAGLDDTSNWLLYGGDYSNNRHSPVTDLNPQTVGDLEVAWAFPTGTLGQFEVSPTIYDGVMYVSSSYNRLFALDPATGDLFWRYDHQYPEDLRLCCGPVNRGVAIAGDLVIMATLDSQLIAFERLTGKIAWQTVIADYKLGHSATSMPMVVGDLAIIGIAGGEFGVRGFFDAYDVKTGERVWRHYTVPAAGEPGVETWEGESWKTGGAPAWTSGAYDPDTDTLYWTTGNPSPDWNGDAREGDNLFSNSILALDPHTGEQKWYFQFTPHDVWDYDGNTQIFLVDLERDGRPFKGIVQANRNGFFYILDRATGAFISAEPYIEQLNWATIDEIGRPIVNPDAVPKEDNDFKTCPSNLGGMNGAWTGALNPDLGLAYIPSIEACQIYQKGLDIYIPGQAYMAGMPETVDAQAGTSYGHLSAIDYQTGKVRWRYRDADPMMGGVASTAGGVIFTGNQSGHAIALDSSSGEVLWTFKMGGGVRSQPVVYQVDGESYVAIGSGNWNTFAAFSGGPVDIPEGGHLFVFKVK
ncbi:MAG TPA: PQQ-dependent dehydrogenase, methanol/ethanol family [Pseudomonadales bacterium]|nr:PQQ-dependent dehydrogenase, methanol/ethanol family [Pseudomonadales bacterium]